MSGLPKSMMVAGPYSTNGVGPNYEDYVGVYYPE